MAEFQEVIKMRNYMCDRMNSCLNCPISPQTHHVQSCHQFLDEYSDEAEKLITEWYNRNSPCTNVEMFRRVFGLNIPFDSSGCNAIRPSDCDVRNCNKCEYNNFWEQEYKGDYRNE